MTKFLITLLFFISHLILSGQILCKPTEIVKSHNLYDKITQADTFFYSQKIFYIRLKDGFNDSVKVFINGHLVLDELIITNESIELAKDLTTRFEKKIDTIELKIILPTKNICLTETLELDYPLLEISLLSDRWKILYRNHFDKLE
jgi:hypothetical protein